jgi:hypothetical protein
MRTAPESEFATVLDDTHVISGRETTGEGVSAGGTF